MVLQDDDGTSTTILGQTLLRAAYYEHSNNATIVVVYTTVLTAIVTIIVIGRALLCRRRQEQRCYKEMSEELEKAQAQLLYLQEKLSTTTTAATEDDESSSSAYHRREETTNNTAASGSAVTTTNKKKEIRIFMDGAFDLLHYGHMNAFRLGKSLGTHLVVGVNSDESIERCKGSRPLLNDAERLAMVRGCKFVDEVVPGCPYIMNAEYLRRVVFDQYNVDYVIHGDDPCVVDGRDVYESAKAAGRYRSIPRTEGVSTTDIVGRMLLMTKEHHLLYETPPPPSSTRRNDDTINTTSANNNGSDNEHHQTQTAGAAAAAAAAAGTATATATSVASTTATGGGTTTLLGHRSKFLTTSRMLQLFSAGAKAPAEDMRVVYIDGAWDMFHPGDVAILKAARERGDYLIVGIHGDAVVNRVRGMNLPLMNLHERVLSVLGCRHVDDVLIDAPYEITPEMLTRLGVDEVVRMKNGDDAAFDQNTAPEASASAQALLGTSSDGALRRRPLPDRYRRVPPGMITTIENPCDFHMGNILRRIHRNQEAFQAKFERKMEAEKQFYLEKHHHHDDDNDNNQNSTHQEQQQQQPKQQRNENVVVVAVDEEEEEKQPRR